MIATHLCYHPQKRNLHFNSCLMSRKFQSGTTVFVGMYEKPDQWSRPTNGGLCIWWSDGTMLGNATLCPPKDSL